MEYYYYIIYIIFHYYSVHFLYTCYVSLSGCSVCIWYTDFSVHFWYIIVVLAVIVQYRLCIPESWFDWYTFSVPDCSAHFWYIVVVRSSSDSPVWILYTRVVVRLVYLFCTRFLSTFLVYCSTSSEYSIDSVYQSSGSIGIPFLYQIGTTFPTQSVVLQHSSSNLDENSSVPCF